MKLKALSILIAIALLFTFVTACNGNNPTDPTPTPQAGTTPTPAPTPIVDLQYATEKTLTDVLSVSIGDGFGEIGYSDSDAGNLAGPQDFLIREDGSICILDTTNARILIFEGEECVGSISILGNLGWVYGQMFDYYDGNFYVLDLLSNQMLVVSDSSSEDHQTIEIIPLPNALVSGDIQALSVDAQGIRLRVSATYSSVTQEYDTVKPHNEESFTISTSRYISITSSQQSSDGEDVTIRVGERRWQLHEGPTEDFGILGADANGNIYVIAYDFETGTSSLIFEQTIRAYDANGNILGYVRIDFLDWVAHPLESSRVMDDGTVYVMSCFEGCVTIQKVVLG